MKAMVIGNRFAEMTEFGDKLGGITDTKQVTHLAQLAMLHDTIEDDRILGHAIEKKACSPSWIIVGNSFTADPTTRIAHADIIFCLRTRDDIAAKEDFQDWFDGIPSLISIRGLTRVIPEWRQSHRQFRKIIPEALDLALGNANEYGVTQLILPSKQAANDHLKIMQATSKRTDS